MVNTKDLKLGDIVYRVNDVESLLEASPGDIAPFACVVVRDETGRLCLVAMELALYRADAEGRMQNIKSGDRGYAWVGVIDDDTEVYKTFQEAVEAAFAEEEGYIERQKETLKDARDRMRTSPWQMK